MRVVRNSVVPLHVTRPPEIRHPVSDRITHMVREEPQTDIGGQFIGQVESILILPEEPRRPFDQEVDGILLRQGHPLGIRYLNISPEVLQPPDVDPVRCVPIELPEGTGDVVPSRMEHHVISPDE